MLEPGPLLGPGVGGELLSEGEVLECEGAARREDGAEELGKDEHEKTHGPAMLLPTEVTSFPALHEVSAEYAHAARRRVDQPTQVVDEHRAGTRGRPAECAARHPRDEPVVDSRIATLNSVCDCLRLVDKFRLRRQQLVCDGSGRSARP